MYEIPEIDWEKQKKHEKIGLFLFVFGIVFIFSAVGVYIFFGHNLDLTASSIDNSVGQLNGYLTLVFDGNNNSRNIKEENEIEKFDSNKQLEKANIDNVLEQYEKKDSAICKIDCKDYTAYPNGTILKANNWNIGVITISDDVLNNALESKKQQLILEKPNSYDLYLKEQEKQKKSNTADYKSFTSNNVKSKTKQMIEIQNKISYLYKKQKADIIVVLASKQDVLDVIEKVDCVITKNVYDNVPSKGKLVNETFVMRLPENEHTCALVCSPAKMFTAYLYKYIVDDKEN